MDNNTKEQKFLLYKTPAGEIKVDVLLQDENIWMTQKNIAELFGVKIPAISKHLKNIFETGELDEKVVVSILENTTKHGAIKNKIQTKEIKFYNLDVIIATGYRVNSMQATKFRIWANKVLKEFIIKGFVMDDQRLKNPDNPFGKDYFDEQLERIRDIRSSERRFYQKVTDIFSLCSIDYDKNSETTKTFFATVQNKLHWAITRKTVAEIIYDRVDSKKEHKTMTMNDWIKKLDGFLQFNEKNILINAGKISKELAINKAHKEFGIYDKKRLNNYISDFDKEIKKLKIK